jgi:Arc/MetJ-type ribon-helix-helix transcriptional regulator
MAKETMVSIRIPSSLVKELKNISEKDHYKDLSELIRYVVRKKSLSYLDPAAAEMKKIKENIFKNQKYQEKFAEKEKNKEKILNELRKLTEELKNEF